jgi:hypothetical protein
MQIDVAVVIRLKVYEKRLARFSSSSRRMVTVRVRFRILSALTAFVSFCHTRP